jgi:hypothetical protein
MINPIKFVPKTLSKRFLAPRSTL